MNRTSIILATTTLLSLFALRPSSFVQAQCVPDSLLKTIPNPAPASGDAFGNSVAVSGNLIVVGAPIAGTAYVLDATTGAVVVTLTNPAPAPSDAFGASVAISGNVAVVGAGRSDVGATDSGTAYVFDATTGALEATLSNPTPAAGDYFGTSIAISGNWIVVGAPYNDAGATDAGTAYAFNATTGALVATLSNPAPAADDLFGDPVAISGNMAVVGASYDDAGATDAGTAYVFNATTGALVATLSNPSPATSDRFGNSVAISGNLTVVAAPQDAAGATNVGTVYVFDATNGALAVTLSNPAPAASDAFGGSVAVSGNVAVVGANFDAVGATDAGTAYVFDASTGALTATLNNPDPTASDFFGGSVAIDGIVAVVGAYADDAGAVDAGSAYTFTCASLIPSPTPTSSPTPTATATDSPSPTPTPSPTPYDGRSHGDFDGSLCTDITDFLFLLDNWQAVTPLGGEAISIADFLALLDNWLSGPAC